MDVCPRGTSVLLRGHERQKQHLVGGPRGAETGKGKVVERWGMKECPHFRSAGQGGPPRGRDRREPGELSLSNIPGHSSKLREHLAPDALRQEPQDLLRRLAAARVAAVAALQEE